MKRFLHIKIILAALLLCVACGTDSGDEPTNKSELGNTVTPAVPPELLTDYLRPVLTDGKRWVTQHMGSPDNLKDYIDTFQVCDDVYYEGYEAKKVVRLHGDGSIYEEEHDPDMEDNSADNVRYEREADGKVYRYYWEGHNYNSSGELERLISSYTLQYDLNAQCGDKIDPTREDVVVVSKGTIVLMGKTRRAVKVYINNYRFKYHYDYWVEGIGPLFDGVPDYRIVRPSTILKRYSYLLECYDGDEKIYDFNEFDDSLYVPEEFYEGFTEPEI